MTIDGNKRNRSTREYWLDYRPTANEKGDFDEVGKGFKYKSKERYNPGDIVCVRARSSRHIENDNESFANGETREVMREAVVVWGRLWRPHLFVDKSPDSGKRILHLLKKNGYQFKKRTALNNPELRKNYWKIITSETYREGDIKKKLSKYGDLGW